MTTTSRPPAAQVPEALPARLLSPALIPRVLFPAVRAGYGAVLLCVPGPALGLSTGRPPSPRARAVARILGARHLAQAALTLWRPRPAMLAAGAGIDGCHAASMLALAAASPDSRRAGLTDAVTEAAFAAAGAVLASTGRAAS